jgi:hypothetical protein
MMDNFPGQAIQRIEEIPVPGTSRSDVDTFRKKTDVCCSVWAVVFGLTLLVWAIAGLNTGTNCH